MLSSAISESIALALEALLYGIYIVLFAICVNVLRPRRDSITVQGNTRLLVPSLLLFILITWHLVVDFIRLEQAFRNGPLLADVDQFFGDVSTTLSVMKTAVYMVSTIVADSIILYRCWVVWNKSGSMMILPGLLFLADIGTGVAAVVTLAILPKPEAQTFSAVYAKRSTTLTEAFFAMTLATNGLCTTLIALRIWTNQRALSIYRTEAHRPSSLNRVIVIVTESGAIYSTALILMLSTYVTKSTAAFQIFLDIISPTIGIVFSLIIVRIGRQSRLNKQREFNVPPRVTQRSNRTQDLSASVTSNTLSIRLETPSPSKAANGLGKVDRFELDSEIQEMTDFKDPTSIIFSATPSHENRS